jgi:hypothetical protein
MIQVVVSSIEILERFQSKAMRMIMGTPFYMPNTVIQRDLQTKTVKEEFAATALKCLPQCTPKWPSSAPHGATKQ